MINKSILHSCHLEGFKEKDVYGAYKIFFGTLVSESRLKIINILRKKRMNVSELINELRADQTAVSHDLARLRQCGFVETEKEGKFVNYYLSEDIREMMHLIDEHMDKYCIHILHEMEGGQNKK
ncbi:winged helix-turn-helix transcriptional regulator [Candidatus Pacearchaeota archaeon]|nr:winged helix-turn-helix transcriptional regulator [Candidatus Pacearchaeota archaeon]